MVAQPAHRAFAALQALAGRYTGRVARLWPAPYDGYRSLPAARRHLAHLVIPRLGRATKLEWDAFVRDVETLRARDFIARWLPDAPAGLENALAKIGDAPWLPTDYRRLVALLGQGGETGLTLRHATAIDARLVAKLETLPEMLRGPAVVRWINDVWEAQVVSETVRLADQLSGRPDGQAVLVERLRRAKTRARFFEMLNEALRPARLGGPIKETELLRPLHTIEDVKEAGRRFRNCLGTCVHRAVFRGAAFVEWRGAEAAVMELENEGPAGWRLVTLLGFANANVSMGTQQAVRRALEDQGIRTGFGADFLMGELDFLVEAEVAHANAVQAADAARAEQGAAMAVAAE